MTYYHIASVSFGKDSLAMLLLILDDIRRGGATVSTRRGCVL